MVNNLPEHAMFHDNIDGSFYAKLAGSLHLEVQNLRHLVILYITFQPGISVISQCIIIHWSAGS